MKECFGHLDADGGGAIGIEELEEPLIGLGFAKTREEVLAMMDEVDEDKSGQIEFPEFLSIINNASSGEGICESENTVNKFFKDMANGTIGLKDLSFGVNI